MFKRTVCCILAALLILGMLPGAVLPSAAAENRTASEACIEILKKMEGFLEKPVADNGQYTVGYGTACGKDDYPNGITEEEADALLRAHMARMELSVNKFLQQYQIVLAQNQFDALMLFTYNCGSGWVSSEGTFRTAVIEGKSGNEFLYAITLWSNANAQLNMGLLNRRLIEADMYLNGSYTNKKPSNYSYVILDSNGGVSDSKAQGYDCNLTARILAEPSRSGYRFLGWYTSAEGGAWITELTPANMEQTVYAHWQDTRAQGIVESAASYQMNTGDLDSLNYYAEPNGTVTGTVNASSVISIVADYVDESGMKWGKTASGKWVRLGDPRVGAAQEEEEEIGIEVTVTGTVVNVRSGPGTNYKVVSSVSKADKLIITETRMVDKMLWGKFRAGWISLQFTNYKGGLTPDDSGTLPEPEEDVAIATGTVTAQMLNIRATPGTAGYLMGCYILGDKVTIFERAIVSGVAWGRTDKGWINLNYVLLDTVPSDPSEEPSTDPATDPTTNPSTEPSTAPSVPPQEPDVPQQPQEGMWGTVTASALIIRKTPGGEMVGTTYPRHERIIILEQKLHQGILWGRTDKGWVSMAYVKLDPTASDNDAGVRGTVTASTLNIRKGPGTGYASVGGYIRGEQIIILEIQANGKTNWGRTDKGWVSMQYVTLETNVPVVPPVPTNPTVPTEPAPTNPPVTTPQEPEIPVEPQNGLMGTVTAGTLIIRKAPGSGSAMVDTYPQHTRIQILEQKLHQGILWGRTDKGWVCMAYVGLDPTGTDSAAGVRGTVTASALIIRKGPGTGYASVGTYPKGAAVIVYEIQANGKTNWGRTDKGWICMQYVTLDTNAPVVPPVPTNPTVPTEPVPSNPPATEPPVTEPIVPPVSEGIGGTVTASGLNVRAAASTTSTIVGYYRQGDRVVVLEQKLINGTVWGRTEKGWVNMAYVVLDPNNQGNTSVGFHVTITASTLIIRKDPSTKGEVMGTYPKGTTVLILETRKVGDTTWGRTDKGWISMQYVTNAVDTPAVPPVTTDPTLPTEPAPTTPPATEPPVTEPPATEPPVTEPPVTEPPATEPVITFNFTCDEFVASLNSILAPYDVIAKPVSSSLADHKCYELSAISDDGSYGVVMYIELAGDGEKAAGIMMVCDAESQEASENLAAFALYAMMIVDNTITEADLQEMLNAPQTGADGLQYYLMQRESGEYAFVLTDALFYFYAYPFAE